MNETMYDEFGFFRDLYLFRSGVRLTPEEIWEIGDLVEQLKAVALIRTPGRRMIEFAFPQAIHDFYPRTVLRRPGTGLRGLREVARAPKPLRASDLPPEATAPAPAPDAERTGPVHVGIPQRHFIGTDDDPVPAAPTGGRTHSCASESGDDHDDPIPDRRGHRHRRRDLRARPRRPDHPARDAGPPRTRPGGHARRLGVRVSDAERAEIAGRRLSELVPREVPGAREGVGQVAETYVHVGVDVAVSVVVSLSVAAEVENVQQEIEARSMRKMIERRGPGAA
ncbi:hypothetical protein ACFQY7_44925 [Actinomadura luteofluorescens]|uniref:hypothetical protein n=1 Tax=Actinomadura luteofluorescens TaxID=46163 RepID=UPI003641A790